MESKKAILSVRNLEVKFRVRGRILTAIRGIDLDIYENESIAIVGESGSGKSVFTKTFAGMLETNGFISSGSVLFDDDELAATTVSKERTKALYQSVLKRLNADAPLSYGAEEQKALIELQTQYRRKGELSEEEEQDFEKRLTETAFERTELFNALQTLDNRKEKAAIRESEAKLKALDAQLKAIEAEKKQTTESRRKALAADTDWLSHYREEKNRLMEVRKQKTAQPLSAELEEQNTLLAKEVTLALGRYPYRRRLKALRAVLSDMKKARELGEDLSDPDCRARIIGNSTLYVRYTGEDEASLRGECVLDMAKITNPNDWTKIRGSRIATVFQDPMTSLNPIITIGEQITSVILKHQDCTEAEARKRALILMKQVGIPNAENRFDDYPFQYSGGMRQRIVIAIALSCQPRILICDEPTTALDVTIQAQILELLKQLQAEYGYTIVFITHDLGVVANIADRVAVMYAGQIVELGEVEEIFYDPRHPYTWALLSSLPQLAQRGRELYSITGTPPSLYNKVTGDAFAPRNPYCMKIDTLLEPPMFQVTDTHYAKTWLLDPRSPKTEKPEAIQNIHEKLLASLNIREDAGTETVETQKESTVPDSDPGMTESLKTAAADKDGQEAAAGGTPLPGTDEAPCKTIPLKGDRP